MDDPTAFGRARLDEGEAAAKALAGEAWTADVHVGIEYNYGIVKAGGQIIAQCGTTHFNDGEARAAHIARHDPARVLLEIEAMRAVLGMHHAAQPHSEFGFTYPAAARFCGYCGPGDNWQAEHEPDLFPDAVWPCLTARRLITIWNDHQDYRQEWAPPPPVRV